MRTLTNYQFANTTYVTHDVIQKLTERYVRVLHENIESLERTESKEFYRILQTVTNEIISKCIPQKYVEMDSEIAQEVWKELDQKSKATSYFNTKYMRFLHEFPGYENGERDQFVRSLVLTVSRVVAEKIIALEK